MFTACFLFLPSFKEMSEVLLRYVAVALEIKPAKQFVYFVLSAQASLRFELISELGN